MLWSGERKSASSLTDLLPKKPLMLKGSVGDDLEHLEKDRAIRTDPEDTRKRRTIRLVKKNDSWQFTLQTYGVKNKRSNEIEVMTYVDYVEYNGPAWIAGLQRGDVFLSINGESVEGSTHQQLVQKIRNIGDSMRVVVLFEDCCRKVELYEKFIKLKQVLSLKLAELQDLKHKENFILKAGGLKRVEELRFSTRSTLSTQSSSSISSDWDRYSFVGSVSNLPSRVHAKRKLLAVNNDSMSDLSFDNTSFSDSDSLLNLASSGTDISQHSIKKNYNSVDNISEYSLPLHSNFQLGGKLLTFSEADDDSQSACSSETENIVPCDTSIPENGSKTFEKSSNSPIIGQQNGQMCDSFVTQPLETSLDDESCDMSCDQPCDTSGLPPSDTSAAKIKRYNNGMLINEEDAITKL